MNDKKPLDFDLLFYQFKCKDSIDAVHMFMADLNDSKSRLFKLEPSLKYSYDQIEDMIMSFDNELIVDVVTKIDWLLDTSVYWRGCLNTDSFEVIDESLIVNQLLGKRLSDLIMYFHLSPLESINVSWSQIFAIAALQQVSFLFMYHLMSDDMERLMLDNMGLNPRALTLDIADCVAKSVTFNQLLDQKWVDSYKSRKAAYSKVKKILPIKKEVIKRLNERYLDTDASSAGMAILTELQQENSHLLKLLKEGGKTERTFAKWIKEVREKPDISTFF